MKTERMVLLVTPQEKAKIGVGAASMGVSASEFVRRLVSTVDADDLRVLDDLRDMMPSVEAALDNIDRNVERTIVSLEKGEERRAYYDSEAYRVQVRDEVLADRNIDWDAARRYFSARQAA
jgi:hypothetical protein